MFSRLAKIEIGGTKGKTLEDTVVRILQRIIAIRPIAQRYPRAEVEAICLPDYLATGIGNQEVEPRTALLIVDDLHIITTKSKTLANSVLQVHREYEYEPSVATFRGVTYDIIDVKTKQFDDAPPISNRFKLYDIFSGLLKRPVIHDELEKKHVVLIQA